MGESWASYVRLNTGGNTSWVRRVLSTMHRDAENPADCNDIIRGEGWSPAWVTENRAQKCSQSERTLPDMQHLEEMLGMGHSL